MRAELYDPDKPATAHWVDPEGFKVVRRPDTELWLSRLKKDEEKRKEDDG